jgi:hypothetical protein
MEREHEIETVPRARVKLTKKNWSTLFKQEFQTIALTYGTAGKALTTGADPRLTEPTPADTMANCTPKYPDNFAGKYALENDSRKYREYTRHKARLNINLCCSSPLMKI